MGDADIQAGTEKLDPDDATDSRTGLPWERFRSQYPRQTTIVPADDPWICACGILRVGVRFLGRTVTGNTNILRTKAGVGKDELALWMGPHRVIPR